MSGLFCTTPRLCVLERQMQQPPGYRPRGQGICVVDAEEWKSRGNYSEIVDCVISRMQSLSARIYGLMTVLKGITEIEMMCLNSRENFEENKRYLKKRAEEESNPVVRKLLELDAGHLDRMQVQMATAREFLLIIRLKNQKESEIFSYLNRIEKMLVEQGFKAKRADEEDIRRILAVYFEQNVTTEKFEEFDGERWIILND